MFYDLPALDSRGGYRHRIKIAKQCNIEILIMLGIGICAFKRKQVQHML